ncbi:MAG: DDE-type integrase/transposase/recombinase [Bacteroidaceae bacterium]|nr:DDE-type integrase/transposase/recombinase [Bacteroidaceae bacterium]
MGCFVENNILFVSYRYLREIGIKEKSIDHWNERGLLTPIKFRGEAYVCYDDIPAPTRTKLPDKETIIDGFHISDDTEREYYQRMTVARDIRYAAYLDEYRSTQPEDKARESARLHAVLSVTVQEHGDYRFTGKPQLRKLYNAFSRLYPGKYGYTHFCRIIQKAKREGIENVVIKRYPGSLRRLNPVIDKWLIDALSSGKCYSYPSIHRMISDLCDIHRIKRPSLSWVKTAGRELMPAVSSGRYGSDKARNAQPYAGIIRAQHIGDQWQIDGWRMPFYMSGFHTLTLFTVLDAHSSKIVGYWVDYEENTNTILKGIENAVHNCGYLPFEILSDNHSFNKTKEAEYFKNTLSGMGVTWKVSENPRYKSLVERSFSTFGTKYCKEMYGYIGEGVRTRRKDGRTSQELVDRYTKSSAFLTEEQIKLIAVRMVEAYNAGENISTVSPEEKYRASEAVHAIPVSELDRMRLFIRQSEALIRRGQINIVRGGVKYEYQLNAKQYTELNDKRVAYRYIDFSEIYLFDIKTDMPLGTVKRKQYAAGALADQAEKDIDILNRNKGRLNGIKTAFKNKQIEIARKAESIDPEAAYAMNARLTPKNIIEDFKKNGVRRIQAERLGVDLSVVTDIPVFSEVQTATPDKKRGKDSPFTPKNHKISILKLNK